MADYTRLIEFKVKGTELTRATDKIFKSLNKIEISVEKTNKGLAVTAKQLKSVAKEANNTEKALNKIVRAFSKLKSPQGFAKSLVSGGFGVLLNNPGKIAKLIAKLGVADAAVRTLSGRTKGLGQTILDLGKKVLSTRKALEGYSQTLDRLIRQHPIATAQLIGFAGGLGAVATYTPQIYNLGKAFRQLTADIAAVDKAGRAGGLKNVLRMFPSGSILGGIGRSGDISKLKFKDLEKEQKKIEKSAKKLAYNYKAAATGLTKLREQLDKSKRIQDKLLAGSDRYNNIARKTLSIEQQITKEEQKRANIKRRMTWGKDLMKLATGGGGLAGKAIDIAGKGLTGGFLADAGIRKLSGLLGKQVGLFQATSVAASKFWQTLQAVNQGARNAATGLAAYGRHVIDLITQHQRLIQVVGGLAGGLDAVGRFTPQIYAAGKAWRQLEYDIRRVGKAFADSGLRGVGALFPKGSMIGRWGRGIEAGEEAFPGEKIGKAVEKAQLSDWRKMGPHPGDLRTHIDGLNKVSKILERNKKIQENISAGTKTHVQAVIAVKQSQFAYNLELLKTKAVQAAVTADIWAAKKAWQGVLSVLQGATGLLGGLLGGAAKTKLGQAAGVIGISDAVKRLAQHIPFVSQAWKDNLQVFATWTQRITEGLTAVTIAHGVFSKAIGAAQWTTGAISGFVKWEKAAFAAFHRVNKGRIDLDRKMAARLAKGENMFTGLGKWLGGGEKRIEEKEAVYREPTRALKITKELEKQKALLAQHNASSSKYRAIRERILKLEELQTKELNTRRRADVRGGGDPQTVFADEFRARNEALNEYKNKAESFRQQQIKATEQQIKKQTNLRIAEDERANAIAMEAKQKIWDAEGKDFDRRLQRAVKLKKAEADIVATRQKAIAATNQRVGRFAESMMLGAGFPLLFGGGVGAVGGGVLGAGLQAATGSKGFGAQIFLSALGTALDQFVQKIGTLGRAFRTIQPDVDALIGALGIAGTETERGLKAVKELAGEQAALAIATERMNALVGKGGVSALQKVGDDTERLANAWTKAMTSMKAAMAGLINTMGIFNALANSLERSVLLQQANRSEDPRQQALRDEYDSINTDPFSPDRGKSNKGRFHTEIRAAAIELQKIINIEKNLKIVTQARALTYNGIIKKLNDQLAIKNAVTEEAKTRLKVEEQLEEITSKLKEGDVSLTEAQTAAIKALLEALNKVDKKKVDYIGDAMKEWKDRLDELANPAYQLVSAADSIGNAFSDAFKGIVSGSMTAGQAFAAFTRSVASHFLDMAAEMAATALKYQIVKMLGSAFAGSLGGGWDSSQVSYTSGTEFNPNASRITGINYDNFAEGGYVSGPTDAIIGEGGEGEYVIPESKMDEALVRYSGGARGSDVIAGDGGSEEGGGGSARGSGSIDVSFTSEVINNVSYVTYAQFEEGVRQAAKQGAQMGEASVYKNLRNNPTTRRSVGV